MANAPDEVRAVETREDRIAFDGMEMHAVRLGWWLGGVGSLIWLPILALVWMVQGRTTGGLLCLALTAAGLTYLKVMAPWRHPDTPIRRLVFGFVAILLMGAAVVVWEFREALVGSAPLPMFFVFTLFLPMTLGSGTWNDLRRRDRLGPRDG